MADSERPGSAGEHVLQRRYGTSERADRFYETQMLDHLNPAMREYLSRQEMMFVSTSDASGECDCTFRAGPAGFVHAVDPGTLVWPEYRGNGVLASLGNLAENAHVGLLFLDLTGDSVGLHVNGRAQVVTDAAVRAMAPDVPVDPVPGRRPERWVQVTVQEAYIHCAKHIPRMVKVGRGRSWGTDDVKRKGGDYFGVGAQTRVASS